MKKAAARLWTLAPAPAPALVLALASASPAGGAEFYPVEAVSSPNSVEGNPGGNPLTNLIEGAGVGFAAEEPHDQTGGTWYTDAPGGFPSDYIEVAGKPILVFDFGGDVPLAEISLWGYTASNANGLSRVSLRFATAAEGEDGFGTSVDYNPFFDLLIDEGPRQSFAFDQLVTARYVELTGEDNFFANNGNGPPPGGDRAGMGEVAFEIPAVTGRPSIRVAGEIALALALEPSTFEVAVSNPGDRDLVIGGTAFTGDQAAAFEAVSVPGTVPALGNGAIVVQFDPEGLGGPVSATLQIMSNDPDLPTAEVRLSGTLPVFEPDLDVPAEVSLQLGAVAATFEIPVGNAGRGELTVVGATLAGPDAGAFELVAVPGTVPALSVVNIEIVFDPAALAGPGAVSARLEITTDDPDTPLAEILLTGGVPAAFYEIVDVTASTAGDDFFPDDNLVQGAGSGFGEAWPHEALGLGADFTWVTAAPGGFPSDYIAVAGEPVLVFDLGREVPLSEISVWGYAATNANGVSRFRLRFATAAEGASGFGNAITYRPTFEPVIDPVPRQSFAFEETVHARYVELTAEATFFSNGGNGPPAGGDRVGLGEVAFEILDPITPPQLLVTEVALDRGSGAFSFTYTSRPGDHFRVEKSLDLEVWTVVAEPFPAGGAAAELTTFIDPAAAAVPRAFYRAVRIPPPPLLRDDFEGGAPGWTTGVIENFPPSDTNWELGAPSNGPGSAVSGANVWGTGLDADYGADTGIFLRSPLVDLSGVGGATLTFWSSVSSSLEEGGRIVLLEADGATLIPNEFDFFTGESGGWVQFVGALPAGAVGKPIYIQFEFLSDAVAGDNGAGWFIDDVWVRRN